MKENLRAGLKLFLFMLTVGAYFLSALIFYPLTYFSPFRARRFLVAIISFYSRLGLRFMGVKVDLKEDVRGWESSFIVSNHLGYLDVLVLASKMRACFVTSLEMRRTPFLGQLCELGGCLYVDRRNKSNLSNEVKMLTEALKSGLNVCVFPEGTSTNGSEVLRFRRPLFRAGIEAASGIKVMCLNYLTIDGAPVSTHNRNSLFWYGDMTFLPHLWNFLKCREVRVALSLVGELAGEQEYGEVSLKAHDLVRSHYRPILSGWPKEEWKRSGAQAQSGAQFL